MNHEKEVYPGVTRSELEAGKIKIGIPMADGAREWCFAQRLSPACAKLLNMCFFTTGVDLHDVVEFAELGDDEGGPHEFLKSFVRVVTKGSVGIIVSYATRVESKDQSAAGLTLLVRKLGELRDFCGTLPEDVRPIDVESITAGFACVAFPPHISREDAEELLESCPVLVGLGDDDGDGSSANNSESVS